MKKIQEYYTLQGKSRSTDTTALLIVSSWSNSNSHSHNTYLHSIQCGISISFENSMVNQRSLRLREIILNGDVRKHWLHQLRCNTTIQVEESGRTTSLPPCLLVRAFS